MRDLPLMNTPPLVYLDHNATTPCAPEVVHAMLPFWTQEYGNASSGHAMGRTAGNAVERARNQVARAIGAAADEVLFTSGATESNNLILRGLTDIRPARNRIVLTAIEHPSVREPCRRLSEQGFEVFEIPVSHDGVLDIGSARHVINENTLLVSVQGANNEIGTLQPVRVIAEIAHERGAFVHCDATQMLGKVPFSVDSLDIDYASFSGHKVYGPKGIGGLFVRRGPPCSSVSPPYRGGSQESRLRPGTLNVPAIVGFGEALRLVENQLVDDNNNLRFLRDKFEQSIKQTIPDAKINGVLGDRLPGTTSLTIPGVPASMLLANCVDLCISDGAACSSGAIGPSHVLVSIGLTRPEAECTVRTSLGRYNSSRDVERAIRSILSAITTIRAQISD